MKMHDRRVVAVFTGGSHMRNLNDEQSDVDKKYFVLPTFEDLYDSKVYAKQSTSETLDEDVQDVRRLETLFYKSNPAYVDLLFSPEIQTFGHGQMNEIVTMRDDIASMNLSNFYSASMGMVQRNVNDLQNPTSEKVAKLIERHAYNPKKAMMAAHLCMALVKYHELGYKDYKKAIWYEGEQREFMMNLKRGKFTFDEAKQIIAAVEKQAKALKDDYKSKELNHDVNNKLQILLRDMVYDSMAGWFN